LNRAIYCGRAKNLSKGGLGVFVSVIRKKGVVLGGRKIRVSIYKYKGYAISKKDPQVNKQALHQVN